MLGQSALTRAGGPGANNRVFVYEVTGLRQTDQTDQASSPIRASGSTFIQVPYGRMNEEMRRITRLGGQIVSIQSLTDFNAHRQTANGQAAPSEAEPAAE